MAMSSPSVSIEKSTWSYSNSLPVLAISTNTLVLKDRMSAPTRTTVPKLQDHKQCLAHGCFVGETQETLIRKADHMYKGQVQLLAVLKSHQKCSKSQKDVTKFEKIPKVVFVLLQAENPKNEA